MNTISAYVATVLVVFSAVGVMLYITAYYLHEDLSKNLVEHCPEAAKSAV